MRILQLVSSSRTSGAEKHVAVLADRLSKRGHDVFAACPAGDWLPEQLRQANIPILEVSMRGISSIKTPGNLVKFIRDYRIELIHAHLTRATYNGLYAARVAGVPIISSVHCRSHDVAYRYLMPQKQSHIISVSDFIRAGLVKKGVSSDRVRTIYNGTEFLADDDEVGEVSGPDADQPAQIDDGLRSELGLPADSMIVGLIARVDEFKGHLVLAKALARIAASCPRAYFVMVGPIVSEVQAEMWQITCADGVDERLRFTGVRNDIKSVICQMQVLTLPSRYEACSMSIIEGMAMGKPIVATRAGGNLELVDDGVTGTLIERNPEALADALIEILINDDRRLAMGHAARKKAIQQYTARVMVDNIERLYFEMLTIVKAA